MVNSSDTSMLLPLRFSLVYIYLLDRLYNVTDRSMNTENRHKSEREKKNQHKSQMMIEKNIEFTDLISQNTANIYHARLLR